MLLYLTRVPAGLPSGDAPSPVHSTMLPFLRTAAWVTLATLGATKPIFADDARIGHSFDSPNTVWRLIDNGVQARVLLHEHFAGGARDELGCERLVVAAPAGQSAIVACAIPHVAVLDELDVHMWLKANRPDIQLAARVVMPRSNAPNGGGHATAIVRGERYERSAQWQQVVLQDLPKLLAAEVRAMRTVPGAKIDPREAFIDAIVLIVPGDLHGVEVLTDELVVDGIPQPVRGDIQHVSFPNAGPSTNQTSVAAALATNPRTPSQESTSSPQPTVKLNGSLLIVEGRTFAPRAIQWQGEPLGFLADLGFNAIQLPSPPTDEQVLDAARHNLWFICVPPRPDQIAHKGLGKADDRVIAWYLDDTMIETDPRYAGNWAELVRQHDALPGRPILMAPEAQWETANQTADIVVARHSRAAVLPLPQYDGWLDSRCARFRPETALWAALPTQFGQQVTEQSAALTGTPLEFGSIDWHRLSELQRIAWLAGCRGIVFQSNSPLNDATNAARHRAAVLQLANARLQFIEPWMAGGKIVSRLASNDARWRGELLYADGTRLLVPYERLPAIGGSVDSPSATSPAELTFVVPGLPESSKAFLMSPVSFRQVALARVAGGTRVAAPRTNRAMLLITENPRIIQAIRQRVARDAAGIARLELKLAELHLNSITGVEEQLAESRATPAMSSQLAAWAQELRTCSGMLAAGRIELAYDRLGAVNTAMADAIELSRNDVIGKQGAVSHPLALGFEQTPAYADFMRAMNSLTSGENLLYGGDFEDLTQVIQFGWQHFTHPTPGMEAGARISVREPRHGKHCLELFATASSHETSRHVDTPPVWIVSPPLPIDTGDIVEISGYVRIDEAIAGGQDGLQIVDTLGGPELALTYSKTSGWQPFQMIRAASQPVELRITFALAGLGSARLDGVMVRILKAPAVRRLPMASSAVDTADSVAPTKSGPLLAAPKSPE